MLTVPSVTPDAISELSAREMRRAVLRRWLFRFSVLIGWIAFVGVWYLFSRFVFNPQRLPEPHVVASECWTLITERDFRTNMQASLARVLGGFLLAVVASTGLGWLIAHNAWWRTLLRTIVQAGGEHADRELGHPHAGCLRRLVPGARHHHSSGRDALHHDERRSRTHRGWTASSS